MAEQVRVECLESEEIEIVTEAPEEETYGEDHDEEKEEVVKYSSTCVDKKYTIIILILLILQLKWAKFMIYGITTY